MRIKVELTAFNNLFLPRGYNSIIQGLIYSFFRDSSSRWLHDKGYKYEKRSFKLFNFSSFLEKGQFHNKEKKFEFPPCLSFYFSSPVEWIVEHFAANFIKQDFVLLHGQKCRISSVSVLKNPTFNSECITIRSVTPIEVHSTIASQSGKIKTIYHKPFEGKFNELINENLRKKWEAYYKDKCPYNIVIEPLFSRNWKEKVYYFRKRIGREIKMIIIKGWLGKFNLYGSSDYLEFAYSTGLGSRNSAGFGMWELINHE